MDGTIDFMSPRNIEIELVKDNQEEEVEEVF